jgi:hypothetical protein
VGRRSGMEGCGKSRTPTGNRSTDLSARSQSLYRLSYPGPLFTQPYQNSQLDKAGIHKSRVPGHGDDYILNGDVNICGLLVWNLLHVTELASRNFRGFLDFWKICARWFESISSYMDVYVVNICSCLALPASCNTWSLHMHYVLDNSVS